MPPVQHEFCTPSPHGGCRADGTGAHTHHYGSPGSLWGDSSIHAHSSPSCCSTCLSGSQILGHFMWLNLFVSTWDRCFSGEVTVGLQLTLKHQGRGLWGNKRPTGDPMRHSLLGVPAYPPGFQIDLVLPTARSPSFPVANPAGHRPTADLGTTQWRRQFNWFPRCVRSNAYNKSPMTLTAILLLWGNPNIVNHNYSRSSSMIKQVLSLQGIY